MTRASHEIDRYATGETDIIVGDFPTWNGAGTSKGFVWAHGATEDASEAWQNWRIPIKAMALRGTVHVGDYGGHTWGSGTPANEVTDRIDDGIDYIVANHGVDLPVALVGMSMGGCSILNYALRNPTKVSCVALLIPLVDIWDARSNGSLAPYWGEIDAIYGAPPTDYSENSPVEFASELDPDLPIHIWSSSNDHLAKPATHTAFVEARPQTGFTDIGPLGHTIDHPTMYKLMNFLAKHHL